MCYYQLSTDLDDEALLESIDESSLETGTVLKDIAENPKHKLCLDTFCKSYNLVKWIKVETRSKHNLKAKQFFLWLLQQFAHCLPNI